MGGGGEEPQEDRRIIVRREVTPEQPSPPNKVKRTPIRAPSPDPQPAVARIKSGRDQEGAARMMGKALPEAGDMGLVRREEREEREVTEGLGMGSVWDSHCHLDFLASKLARAGTRHGEDTDTADSTPRPPEDCQRTAGERDTRLADRGGQPSPLPPP